MLLNTVYNIIKLVPAYLDMTTQWPAHLDHWSNYTVTVDKLSGKIFNGPLQALSIVLIALLTVLMNVLVAISVKRDISRTCVSRVLLELACLGDAIGVVFALLFPFCVAVTYSGRWLLGETMCHINAASNVFIWLQHFVFIIASKFDSAYTTHLVKANMNCDSPRFSQSALRRVKIFAIISSIVSLAVSSVVTAATGGHFHRVLLLCLPDVPTAFYVVILVLYFVAVIATAFGYLAIIVNSKHQQRKIYCLASASSTITAISKVEVMKSDVYEQAVRSAWASFGVTMAGFVVTLPTVVVLGLPQFENRVPLFVYFVLDVIFYSEFMLNPLLLVVVNRKIRSNVKQLLSSIPNRFLCCNYR